jgi:hypothetical protein
VLFSKISHFFRFFSSVAPRLHEKGMKSRKKPPHFLEKSAARFILCLAILKKEGEFL